MPQGMKKAGSNRKANKEDETRKAVDLEKYSLPDSQHSDPEPAEGKMAEVHSSREQTFLEEYFYCLSHFEHERAKELSEKERDCSKVGAGLWYSVATLLTQLAGAEKTYYSLMFLTQKWFSRRDTLRTLYHLLMNDFRKIEEKRNSCEAEGVSTSPQDEQRVDLCRQLYRFTSIRCALIDFYEQLALIGQNKISYDDLLTMASEISQTHSETFQHPTLEPLRVLLSLECTLILSLLQAQIKMTLWQFMPSLVHLHEANMRLQDWSARLPVRETKKLSFGSSRQPVVPMLYQWFGKYHGMLVSKFTLYFYEILNREGSSDFKNHIGKVPVDFYTKIVGFQKKSDAATIALVFDIVESGVEYKGPGYQPPLKEAENVQGLDSYPAILSYPQEPLQRHWPGVVSLISRQTSEKNGTEKVFYFYDQALQCSYFLCWVEPCISLVIIFDCKKPERDAYTNNFINDLSTQLRCIKIFTALRLGTKT